MTAKPLLHICRTANASFTNIKCYDYLFIAKLQIALKEASETGYWLELLFKTNYIDEATYKSLSSQCTSIRVMLISSINTAKQNSEKSK